jgi:phytoene desaturase
MKKVIVIGAGTAGLASAIRLQALGCQVEIYEKNEKVGGRMYQYENKGYFFDYGPTITMMPEEYKDVFRFSGANPDDYLNMIDLNPLYKLHFQDGTTFSVSSKLHELTKTLENFGAEDARGYLNYLQDVYERYVRADKHFLSKTYRKPSDFYNVNTLYQGLKLRTLNNAYDSISHFVKDEKLRQALSFQTLYIGVSPFQGPSIYTIIPMIELMYGIHYIKGGMYQMAKAMEKRFLELGGKIHLNQNVEEIVVKDHIASGIKVSSTFVEADLIVTNADFPWAIKHLIKDDKERGKYHLKKVDRMTYSSSVFIMYLGLSKRYETPVHSLKFAKDFKKNIQDLFTSKVPDDPSFYMYSPTQIDDSVAPVGKEILYILVPVPNTKDDNPWNQTYNEAFKERVLNMVEQVEPFHDIKKHIEVIHYSTPNDWEHQFNLNHGATFGLRPVLNQSLYFRPQAVLKPLKNVYFTGSSTHPGPGVPIVLKSARLVVDAIKKDYHL